MGEADKQLMRGVREYMRLEDRGGGVKRDREIVSKCLAFIGPCFYQPHASQMGGCPKG